MQVVPAAHRGLLRNVKDLTDPGANIEAGSAILHGYMQSAGGDLSLALKSYGGSLAYAQKVSMRVQTFAPVVAKPDDAPSAAAQQAACDAHATDDCPAPRPDRPRLACRLQHRLRRPDGIAARNRPQPLARSACATLTNTLQTLLFQRVTSSAGCFPLHLATALQCMPFDVKSFASQNHAHLIFKTHRSVAARIARARRLFERTPAEVSAGTVRYGRKSLRA
jgi:hypothetical protein